ncbi:hypothetical protein B0I35DRAFT_439735 [Stachybotrys elegans]|uniref:FAD-binding PCMH-type domain-containing protein n=1 Tax=Stachybotrys elegans TaxID=80388 RepID=A0A8K0SNS5_9HYPO|nr:hypothetical protein B0I35DRAFT_439735 [Stachybotrys elegans]
MSIPKAIEAVQKISTKLVALPDSEEYNEIIKSYYTELERELRPACFLTPYSPGDVADILKALKPLLDSPVVAIAGAGQQTTPGAANIQGGITIHLRNLRGIDIDEEHKTISVGAGENMGHVYEKAAAMGLGVAGNRHARGGIGGEALQGGLSYYSYSRGFICDGIVNYQVVLASGEIVDANAETNRDLWIALRGGGNNFGIVTRFDFTAFPQGQLWGGKVYYFESSFPGQIKSLVDYLHEPNPDVDVHICLSLGYAATLGSTVCMNDIFSLKPEKPKSLELFADIDPQIEQMKTLRVASLKDLTTEIFEGAFANRVVKMTTTVKSDTNILEYAVQTYHEAFKELKDIENILFSLTFEPIPIYSVNKAAIKRLESEAQSNNVSVPYLYLNYGFPHQDVMRSYGSASLDHLRKASSKYDPDGFFQKAGAGLFKL